MDRFLATALALANCHQYACGFSLTRCRKFRRGANRLAEFLLCCARGEITDPEPPTNSGSWQDIGISHGEVHGLHPTLPSSPVLPLSQNLGDVTDSDMVDDQLVTCSCQSKVFTSEEDTTFDQSECEDMLLSSTIDTIPNGSVRYRIYASTELLHLTPFVCEETVLSEPQRAEHVLIKDSKTERSESVHDCDILQSILSDGHYEVADEDRAALQAVISTLSQDSNSQTTTVNDDIDVSHDHDIIWLMLKDGNYEISAEDNAALQMIIGQDGSHITTSSTDDNDMDVHDYGVLKSILSDGNYEILPDDYAALETTMTDLHHTITATNLRKIDADESPVMIDGNGIGSQDCAILQSILNDGDYEIADEDHIALGAVINILISDTDDSAQVTITDTISDKHTNHHNCEIHQLVKDFPKRTILQSHL